MIYKSCFTFSRLQLGLKYLSLCKYMDYGYKSIWIYSDIVANPVVYKLIVYIFQWDFIKIIPDENGWAANQDAVKSLTDECASIDSWLQYGLKRPRCALSLEWRRM